MDIGCSLLTVCLSKLQDWALGFKILPSFLGALSIKKGAAPVSQVCRAEADYYHVRSFVSKCIVLWWSRGLTYVNVWTVLSLHGYFWNIKQLQWESFAYVVFFSSPWNCLVLLKLFSSSSYSSSKYWSVSDKHENFISLHQNCKVIFVPSIEKHDFSHVIFI